jgi:hypothetical protein
MKHKSAFGRRTPPRLMHALLSDMYFDSSPTASGPNLWVRQNVMTRTKSYGLHGHTVCVFATESPPIRLVRLKREDLMCIHKALRTLTNRWNYIGMTTAQFGVGKSNSHWNSLPLEDVSHSLWENISQTDPPVNFALKCSIRPGVSLNLQLTPYRML